MVRLSRPFAGMLVLIGGFGLLAWGQSKPEPARRLQVSGGAPNAKPGQAEAAAAEQGDEKAILASAGAFEKLYNAHDARGLAALYALKAEITDANGELVKGRDAIEAEYKKQFEAAPQCSIEIKVNQVRLLSANIALEDGQVKSRANADEPVAVSNYTCVHVRVEGQWLLASVTDSPAPVQMTPHDHLQELAWMVGDWVNEDSTTTVRTSCEWHEGGNFLMTHFAVQARGRLSMHGTTRIGWDAVAKQFRSWTFDSEGGFAEGRWIPVGDEWIVKMSGSTPDGEICSSTNVYRRLNNDTFTFRSYDRVIAGTLTEGLDEIVIKRRAPDPAE